jgi:pyrroloquinoline quinone (PQQ) biosynthesis protein C
MRPYERLKLETRSAQHYLFTAPILEDVALGRFDLGTYVRFLTNAYHHVKHTVPLMMACGARLPDRSNWMRERLKQYIDEEIGHEQWILDDIAACGADSSEVERGAPPFAVELLVSYVYDYINRRNPVGLLGMVHVLEGTSTRLATEIARLVQNRLGLPDDAFRYLRSHGALDQAHVAFFEDFVNELTDPPDVDAMIHVANRVYRLYGDVIRSARDEELCDAA